MPRAGLYQVTSVGRLDLDAEWCQTRERCAEADRWYCAQLTDWIGRDGRQPWGDADDGGLLRYLASMTADEHKQLAETAAGNLDNGWWQGCETANGGWEDGTPWSEEEAQWRTTARDFLDRYLSGDRDLTEGMIHHASWDLARELAWIRGWCPR